MPAPNTPIGSLKGHPVYLLQERTVDGCERIIWGEAVRDKRWNEPQYKDPENSWGTSFDPQSRVGQIGFCDITLNGLRPHDTRLDGYLMRIRIGIAHHLRNRGLGHALQEFCERYAVANDLRGVAAFNPPATFDYPDHHAFIDHARRQWYVKRF